MYTKTLRVHYRSSFDPEDGTTPLPHATTGVEHPNSVMFSHCYAAATEATRVTPSGACAEFVSPAANVLWRLNIACLPVIHKHPKEYRKNRSVLFRPVAVEHAQVGLYLFHSRSSQEQP